MTTLPPTSIAAPHTYCLILAGGDGRRLWPYSRKACPKQFLDFYGAGKSLLRLTYERFLRFIPAERILVSTYADYTDLVREQLPELPTDNLLAEPVQLGTAPVAAWGALHALSRDAEATLVFSPADQHIVDEGAFTQQLQRGATFAHTHGKAVVLGVQATIPNTNYGYIQRGEATTAEDFYTVQTFAEKPDRQYAELFVESGDFLWNSGLFIARADHVARHSHTFLPNSEAVHLRPEDYIGLTPEALNSAFLKHFVHNAKQSLDTIWLERLIAEVVVERCTYGWADMGTWHDVADHLTPDVDGNVAYHPDMLHLRGCKNTLVSLPEGKAGIIEGLEDYLVADHGHVLVIVKRNNMKQLRHIANELVLKKGQDYA